MPDAAKRRNVNMTIREDMIADAKALKLNVSKAAEAGIAEAVKRAKAEQWLKENGEAINAHNDRMSGGGPLLRPSWDASE